MIRFLNKIDSFDALIKLKREIVYIYHTKIASFSFRRRKHIHYVPEDQPVEQPAHEDILDTIIASHDEPSVKEAQENSPDQVLTDEQKTLLLKKRKLLEKIIYDAL